MQCTPSAGQGVNLGFQDAARLATELEGRSAIERPATCACLRRYARARREDVVAMQFVTDGLDRLFASRSAGVAWLRNAGLSARRPPLVGQGRAAGTGSADNPSNPTTNPGLPMKLLQTLAAALLSVLLSAPALAQDAAQPTR
jgi:2-polyprenyl-6-methoxyphenol hydroxylase-like FAD-dependent oxidoreductase